MEENNASNQSGKPVLKEKRCVYCLSFSFTPNIVLKKQVISKIEAELGRYFKFKKKIV